MRAIDGDALIEKLGIAKECNDCKQNEEPYCRWKPDVVDICEEINDAPTIEPERKKGKWNSYYHGINEIPSFTYSCNQCGYSAPYGLYGGKYSQKEWNFCPSCGADMRGEHDE